VTVVGRDVNGITFSLQLSNTDVDAIKQKGFCTAQTNCYARFEEGVFVDMGQALSTVAVADADAKQASSFTPDETNPPLAQFTKLDYNTGELTFKFNEPVNPGEMDAKQITLNDHDGNQIESTLTLTGGTTSSAIGSTIVVKLNPPDLNALKTKALCKSRKEFKCFVKMGTTFIKDMSGNPVDVDGSTDLSVKEVVLDTGGPVLKKTEINI
jgi:hypothetical protein